MNCTHCKHTIYDDYLHLDGEEFYHYSCVNEMISYMPLVDARDFNNALKAGIVKEESIYYNGMSSLDVQICEECEDRFHEAYMRRASIGDWFCDDCWLNLTGDLRGRLKS